MAYNRRRWCVLMLSVISTFLLIFAFQYRQTSERQIAAFNTPDFYGEKIDWHDYKKINEEGERTGIGEHGLPATLQPFLNKTKEILYKVNGYNGLLSDFISLNRSIPDARNAACKDKKYLKNLDSVSIIIPFHNDHFSVLARTVWSVINRSPDSLIHEIILVDDYSTKVELMGRLDDYAKKHWPKVVIERLPKRSGLIRGKLAGARRAKAKTLVFLDSHSELNVNWLPPLLEPIAIDYRTCTVPLIDVINYETFAYSDIENRRGGFDWYFVYVRVPLRPEEAEHPAEPYMAPIMNGGYFAISAKFFWELGAYDPGLLIWGAEQYELSFKIWMCGGGKMLEVPCSRTGHLYRKFSPFLKPQGFEDYIWRNYKRVIEVWMDEYGDYVYKRYPHLKTLDAGDLTEQKALREKLHCKSFKWFLKNVAYDILQYYPPLVPSEFGHGEIRNVEAPHLCLDAKEGSSYTEIVANDCNNKNSSIKGKQKFQLSWRKDIRIEENSMCFDVYTDNDKAPINLYPCHGAKGNQMWRYSMENQWLVHIAGSRCLDVDSIKRKVYVTTCDTASSTQKWKVEYINETALRDWDDPFKYLPHFGI